MVPESGWWAVLGRLVTGRWTAWAVLVPARVDSGRTSDAVQAIRTAVRADLPTGVRAQVTGGAGFTADINDSFSGANTTLLVTTAAVVAVLLLLTYRSPVLWLIPL